MYLRDRLTLDGPRRDSSGNFIASVLAARIGTQDYAGYELGKPEMARVTMYRPAEEVFSRDSMASFAGAPVTIEHPDQMVTPENWKDHAVGEVASDDIVKDGEAIRVPFMLRDADAISTVEGGKREISMGYTSTIEWGDGVAPDGTPYQATQRQIRINHLAIVDRARGGPTLRIGDQEKPMPVTMLVDGLTVDVSNADTAKATIATILAARDAATAKVSGLETQVATLTTDKANLDAEKVTLTQQLSDATKPEKLRDAAKAYQSVVDKAKTLGVTITDAMGETEIVKAVVDAKIDANARQGWSDAQYAASFASIKAGDTRAFTAPSGAPIATNDTQSVRDLARASRY